MFELGAYKGYTYLFIINVSPETYIYGRKYLNPVAETFLAYDYFKFDNQYPLKGIDYGPLWK